MIRGVEARRASQNWVCFEKRSWNFLFYTSVSLSVQKSKIGCCICLYLELANIRCLSGAIAFWMEWIRNVVDQAELVNRQQFILLPAGWDWGGRRQCWHIVVEDEQGGRGGGGEDSKKEEEEKYKDDRNKEEKALGSWHCQLHPCLNQMLGMQSTSSHIA